MKNIVKKNYKILIGIVIGIIISITIVYSAENILSSNDVLYNNETSGGNSNTVQGALDELYNKANSCKEYIPNDNPNRNIVKAYKYDEKKDSKTFCISGEEETCFITSCYDNKAKDSCPSGTIIEYKVNNDSENNIIKFHIIKDDGSTLTLQSQQNTVDSTPWCNGNVQTSGPVPALEKLETATSLWSNVNTLNYSIGDSNSTLGYSGCDNYNNCSTSTYTLSKNNVKARMITVQEAKKFGCTRNAQSCPIWMYNYLKKSTQYGGTSDGNATYDYYWIMSANPYHTFAWGIGSAGDYNDNSCGYSRSVRAVVEINK